MPHRFAAAGHVRNISYGRGRRDEFGRRTSQPGGRGDGRSVVGDLLGTKMRAPFPKRDGERGPEPLLALDGNGAAVQGDELLGECEPNPRSRLRAGRSRAMEPVEYEIEVGRRYARAAVPNRDPRGAVVATDGHADGTAVGRELEGVREQVRERSLEMIRVAVNDRLLRRVLDVVGDGLSLRQRDERAGDTCDERADLHAAGAEHLSSRLDARELEDLVDQVEHASGIP